MLLVEPTGMFKVGSTQLSIYGRASGGGTGVGLMDYLEVNGHWREDQAF